MTARVYVSATHKSSGKTTVSIGLCAALSARGMVVQPYKKGPDYIDPLWLTAACQRPCYNLDYHTMTRSEVADCYARASVGADILLTEGNKGLFDGVALDGSDSNATLARELQSPVVLVIDAKGITRGIAPLVMGYRHFDPDLVIGGIILNRVGGARHESKLRAVLANYTDVPVVGALWESSEIAITERHLGLVPRGEWEGGESLIAHLGKVVGDHVDVAAIASWGERGQVLAPRPAKRSRSPSVRIGVALDRAFSFYYPGDLLALEAGGAELVFFDTLHDAQLPPVDALFIGGGFPETQGEALARNVEMRHALRAAIDAGMPAYAECGGLMYLTRSLHWQGQNFPMVGAIAADTVMDARPAGHGYVRIQPTIAHPWAWSGRGSEAALPAHEFHYSRLVNVARDTVYAYDVTRGTGINGHHDGIVYKNLLAGYAHLREVEGCDWTGRFLDFVRACRERGHATRRVAPVVGAESRLAGSL